MSELISLILLLREEAINDQVNECITRASDHYHQEDSFDMHILLNKLQVLPLPEKPLPSQAVMGCLPQSVSFGKY